MEADPHQRGRCADVGQQAQRAGQPELRPAAQQRSEAAQALVGIGQFIVEHEIEAHGDYRGHAVGDDEGRLLGPVTVDKFLAKNGLLDDPQRPQLHCHTHRANRAEQREPRRDDPPEPLVVKPDEEFKHHCLIELALALRAGGEIHRQFLDPQRLLHRRQNIEQDLEADARKPVRVCPQQISVEHEITAHGIGKLDAGNLVGELVGEA